MKKLPNLFFSIALMTMGASCQKNTPLQNPSHTKNLHQLRLNLCHEPATMDPRKGGDIVSSHMHFMLFEGLTRLHADGTTTPAQAKSIDVSPDGRVYTFHMRGTTWSDGTPVTAYDFEKSWKDILDPSFPSVNAHLFYPIKNAEAAKKGLVALSEIGISCTDANTFVVTLEKPTPYFLDLTSFCVFFPVSKAVDEAHPDWAYQAGDHFISNGPYRLKEWKHNNEILTERNPLYWKKENVLPDTIHLSMIDNAMTALQMFENGDLDMVGNPLSPLPIDALPALNRKGKLKKKPVAGTTFVTFNTRQFPFSNAKIRKAFALAINRDEIIKNITQLNEQVATNAVPPVLKNNRVREFFHDHDLEAAQELFEQGLQELGISREDFKEITYLYTSADMHHQIAQAIQQQISKTLGIKIKLEGMENKVLLDRLTKRDYVVAETVWVAQYNDQMNILERFKYRDNAKNYPSWENPDYIRLLDQSAFETGEERLATLEKAEEIFLDEMPVAPIYHWDFSYLVQPYLSDVGVSPIGDVLFQEIELAVAGPAGDELMIEAEKAL